MNREKKDENFFVIFLVKNFVDIKILSNFAVKLTADDVRHRKIRPDFCSGKRKMASQKAF